MGLKIKILYCGGWGYAPKFRKLKQDLESRFSGQLEITGEAIPGNSGFFEVQIVGGKLLHSKKNGDGYVDNSAKLDNICKGIQEALAAWNLPLLRIAQRSRRFWKIGNFINILFDWQQYAVHEISIGPPLTYQIFHSFFSYRPGVDFINFFVPYAELFTPYF